jgi:hypothetical protein
MILAALILIANGMDAELLKEMLASGEVFAVAPDKMMILASFTGIMYVQDKESSLNGVIARCPAVQRIDMKLGSSE